MKTLTKGLTALLLTSSLMAGTKNKDYTTDITNQSKNYIVNTKSDSLYKRSNYQSVRNYLGSKPKQKMRKGDKLGLAGMAILTCYMINKGGGGKGHLGQ